MFSKSIKEYISRQPVIPISKQEFNSGLEAMLQFGIKVYFVGMNTLLKIQNAADQGWEIIKSLSPHELE